MEAIGFHRVRYGQLKNEPRDRERTDRRKQTKADSGKAQNSPVAHPVRTHLLVDIRGYGPSCKLRAMPPLLR